MCCYNFNDMTVHADPNSCSVYLLCCVYGIDCEANYLKSKRTAPIIIMNCVCTLESKASIIITFKKICLITQSN